MEKKLPRIKALLTPGEVAKRSGVAVSALHFYESKGLITSIRNSGNQRRYKRDVLRYVAIIKIAQRIGIPLATIGEGVVCGRGRNPTLRLWPTIFSGKIDVFPGDRRSRLISSMTSVAPA